MTSIRIGIIAMLLFCSLVCQSQGFLRASGQAIVDGDNREVILRGMGLGGWMLQEPYMLRMNGIASNQTEIRSKLESLVGRRNTGLFYDAWLTSHCTKGDIDSMAKWGFNSVRLPLHFNLFTLPAEDEPVPGTNTWLTKGFALTDSLLKWCAENKLFLILDLHAAPGGQGNDVPIADRDTLKPSLWNSAANRNKTVALWKELARRYANEPWIGAYDIINEPNWGFQDPKDRNGCAETANVLLRQLMVDITEAIRSVDKNHMIIIEGNCWGNNYSGIFPLWDNNMVISFHKYWNFNDRSAIERFLAIRDKYKVPIWCGESGENSNAWFRDAITLLEANRIGWAWWPLKKIGSNNPLEIVPPAGYDKLLRYLRGENVQMDTTEALAVLKAFARSTHISQNRVKHDVIDAMFRQIRDPSAVPYKAHRVNDRYVLHIPDYDFGPGGIAYHDTDSGNYWVSTQVRTAPNRGGSYRNDGVDIGLCDDSINNGYYVGWTEAGEWLQYTMQVSEAGWYQVSLRARSSGAGRDAAISVRVNSSAQNGSAMINRSKKLWHTVALSKVWLNKGDNTLRLVILEGGADLNYLELTRSFH